MFQRCNNKFMPFSATEKLKALALVAAFETGSASGKFSTVAVLDDGAGVSYGFSQFTHRSGALADVLERYKTIGGTVGTFIINGRMSLVRRQTPQAIAQLSADIPFRNSLRAAGITDEMKQAQVDIALERFLRPAECECERMRFTSPLALAVIHDSMVHGSWIKIRDRITRRGEHEWIREYVETRDKWLASIPRLASTRYRTRFFLNQIKLQNWELNLPLRANGVAITEDIIDRFAQFAGAQASDQQGSAVGPQLSTEPPTPPQNSSTSSDVSSTEAQPPNVVEQRKPESEPPAVVGGSTSAIDNIESHVNAAAAKYDQVERIATTVTSRNDAAKSLWTTVFGSVTQTFWAVFGLIAGVPREVWLVVALIAAALMLMYLYRQIELGKIRERRQF